MEDTSLEDFVDTGEASGESEEAETTAPTAEAGTPTGDGPDPTADAGPSGTDTLAGSERERDRPAEHPGDGTREPDAAVGGAGTPRGTEDPLAATETVATTYQFTPAERACDACGRRVERRWRDDDALVCGACKSW